METFTGLKDFVKNPNFQRQRKEYTDKLNISKIDTPIVDIIKNFNKLKYCFTLQCCYGHFLFGKQKNPQNIKTLPSLRNTTKVVYRIAYMAFCIDNSNPGKQLLQHLRKIPQIAPGYIQTGCAEWFWERLANSYVIQVEPERFMAQDTAVVNGKEAVYLEKIRNQFFTAVNRLLQEILKQKIMPT